MDKMFSLRQVIALSNIVIMLHVILACSDASGSADFFYFHEEENAWESNIIRLTMDGERVESGLVWCNSDEFSEAREGYYPGFTVLPMTAIEQSGDTLRFSLDSRDSKFFSTPIDINICSIDEAWHKGYHLWNQEPRYFADSVAYTCLLSAENLEIIGKSKYQYTDNVVYTMMGIDTIRQYKRHLDDSIEMLNRK